jgi:hypothetical protein
MDNELVIHRTWQFKDRNYHILIKAGVILVNYDVVLSEYLGIREIAPTKVPTTKEDVVMWGRKHSIDMVALNDLQKIAVRLDYESLFRFCQACREVFKEYEWTPVAESEETTNCIWNYKGIQFRVLLTMDLVFIEFEKIRTQFPVIQSVNPRIFGTSYAQINRWDAGKELALMISLNHLKTIVASIYDVDLLQFWDAFYAKFEIYNVALEVDKLVAKEQVILNEPPLSHNKAALLWQAAQQGDMAWGSNVYEQMITSLEDYVCFPYPNPDDIDHAISLGIMIHGGMGNIPSKRISDHLINYFLGDILGKEAE